MSTAAAAEAIIRVDRQELMRPVSKGARGKVEN